MIKPDITTNINLLPTCYNICFLTHIKSKTLLLTVRNSFLWISCTIKKYKDVFDCEAMIFSGQKYFFKLMRAEKDFQSKKSFLELTNSLQGFMWVISEI